MNTPKISIIAALSENRVIGKDNRLPWTIREDLIRLKAKTKDHVVILGRKSFDSMVGYYDKTGKSLPGKLYIVVTRDAEYKPTRENAIAVNSIEEALRQAQGKAGDEEVFVIGGQNIFEQTLPLADRLYLTVVKGDFEGDAFFPDYSMFKKEIGREERKTNDGLEYTFLDLER